MLHLSQDSSAVAMNSTSYTQASENTGHELKHLLYVKDGPISESSSRLLPTACYCRQTELMRDGYSALCEKPYTLITFSYINLVSYPVPDFSQFFSHQFHSLTTLHFTKTGLDNEHLDSMHLETVENLRELTLAKNNLTEFPLKLVMSLLQLEELDLSSNVDMRLSAFSKGFDYLAAEISSREHRSLKILNLHGCDIWNVSEQFFWLFPKLADLDLSSNPINQLPSSCYDQLTDLQKLNLEHNILTDIPPSLVALQQSGCVILTKHNRFEQYGTEPLTGTDTD